MKWSICAVAFAGICAACTTVEMPQADEGRALFAENCAVCHGGDARGGGPMAENLSPAPPDLTALSLGNGGVFPREAVLSTVDGYTRHGGDDLDMPEFGILLEGDLVPFDSGDGRQTPTPRKLVALVEYLETLQMR